MLWKKIHEDYFDVIIFLEFFTTKSFTIGCQNVPNSFLNNFGQDFGKICICYVARPNQKKRSNINLIDVNFFVVIP